MNWVVTGLLVLLLGLVGFYAFEQRSEKKERESEQKQEKVERDTLLLRFARSEAERLYSAKLIASGQASAQRGEVDLQRSVNQTLIRLRGQTSLAQYRESIDRLVAAKLLDFRDTLSRINPRVVPYDTLLMGAVTAGLARGDTAVRKLSDCTAALGVKNQMLADTLVRLSKLEDLSNDLVETRGVFTGKVKRFKRRYASLRRSASPP